MNLVGLRTGLERYKDTILGGDGKYQYLIDLHGEPFLDFFVACATAACKKAEDASEVIVFKQILWQVAAAIDTGIKNSFGKVVAGGSGAG